jgi:hypothetical protein
MIPLPNNNVVLSYNYVSDIIEYQPTNGTCVSSKMPHSLQLSTPYYSHNDENCYSELGNGCYDAGFTTQQSKVW